MNQFYISMTVFLLLSSCGFLMLTSNVHWFKKVFVICSLMIAGMLSFRAYNTAFGYPQLLQNNYEDTLVISFFPDKSNNIMYLWLKHSDMSQPIAYRMPYSIKLHKVLEKTREEYCGQPYRSTVNSENYPLERMEESVDEVEVIPLPMIPPKTLAP